MNTLAESSDLHFGAGLCLGASETATEARWLEELGYEYLSAGEHFMRGNPPGPTHAVLPLLGVAAGATSEIRVLSSIVLTPFYHPLMLAKFTTTLDIASQGRLTLGVGVGGEFPQEFEAANLSVTNRGARTDECLAITRDLWTGETVSYQGKHFQVKDISLNPIPIQSPAIPIWVAGRRDAAMRRAVKFGDGWLPYFYSPERYSDSVIKIQDIAKNEKRDMSSFQWGFFPYISIYPSVDEAARVAADALGGRYLYDGNFADIVRNYCLLGPVQNCIDRLQEFIDVGARYIIFSVACPMEDRARHLETIAKEIIPHFLRG
ncbi:MAG: LLM class flavin-dependent oxidoreductase [Chloroflexota bacterium]|nr:LLM class flavin-dependent oxidoreductase [Chloroflexota bacterium]